MKAFLGMGHLGSNFVKAMIRQGEPVQVWNRTAAKAKVLEAGGAKAFDDVADAVKGATVVHLTLKDDATVNEVLTLAEAGLTSGALILDHTTTSVEGAVSRTKTWREKGYTYLHAPVFMGPQNALDSTGTMMVSGDQELIAAVTPQLAKLTGKVLNFGTEPGKAAGIKLLGNLFLLTLTAGLTDMLSLAKTLNIATADIFTLFQSWNPGAAVPARLKKMMEGNYDQPTWELDMARKDAGLMLQEAGDKELNLVPVIAVLMDQWIAKGHGKEDWTVIAKNAI